MRYFKKEGTKKYNLTPSIHDRMGIGMLLTKIEFWSFQYDFSFQFWGPDNNNVFIENGNIELTSFGGEATIKDALNKTIEWCERSNPAKNILNQLSVKKLIFLINILTLKAGTGLSVHNNYE